MARKRLAAEQIVTKLRQIEVLQAQGKRFLWLVRKPERQNKATIVGATSMAVSVLIRPSD